jgi:uncharacterized protein YkwD
VRHRVLQIVGLAVTVLVVVAALAAPAVASQREDYQAEILRLIGAARAERGLSGVHVDASLSRAALRHARDMLRREYFSHTSLDGSTCPERARRSGYRTAGYRSWGLSEVIAWGMGERGSPKAVFDGWMRSPYHRSVILGKGWRDVGVACVEGSYRGFGGSFMYTVDFGRRTH